MLDLQTVQLIGKMCFKNVYSIGAWSALDMSAMNALSPMLKAAWPPSGEK